MPVIIALDLATMVGVAVGEPGQRPLLFSERMGAPGAKHGAVFNACGTLLDRLIRQHQPAEIAVEKPVHGKQERAAVSFKLIGLRAMVYEVAYRYGVPVNDHPVSTVRLHFIQVGNLPGAKAKPRVYQRCLQLGWRPDSLDSADAAAVWDYACALRSRAHAIATQPGLFATREA